jgi:plastocyanin
MHSRLVLCLLLVSTAPLGAQARLDRSPNLGGTWVPEPGVLQFNFIHRFYVTADPTHTVQNYPTFTLATGVSRGIGVGLRYATQTATSGTNEVEFLARWQMRQSTGDGFNLALTPAFNASANSFDAELGADWSRGGLTLSLAARAMSQPYDSNRARFGVGGGAVFRLNDYVALAGDAASLLDADPGEEVAWSAGLLLVIPSSPHTFSLHASNVVNNTTAGSSRGVSQVFYGFEFTIPIRLNRFGAWFGKGATSAAAAPPADVERAIQNFSFGDTIVVRVGQTVGWTNRDPVEHDVVFDENTKSPLLATGGRWVRRFDSPGTYPYACEPHPYMTGVVIVR